MSLWDDWLSTRPECVRKLAAEFPLETTIDVDGEILYLVGYNEGDMLIMSPINPFDDYDGALANKKYICASHLRRLQCSECSYGLQDDWAYCPNCSTPRPQ